LSGHQLSTFSRDQTDKKTFPTKGKKYYQTAHAHVIIFPFPFPFL